MPPCQDAVTQRVSKSGKFRDFDEHFCLAVIEVVRTVPGFHQYSEDYSTQLGVDENEMIEKRAGFLVARVLTLRK